MAKRKIYLSGAMGCYANTDVYPRKWRIEAIDKLLEIGEFKFFNPVDYYNYDACYHNTEKEVMLYEFRMLKECDIILVNLKDIDKSIGTCDEVLLAYLNNKAIIGFLNGDEQDIQKVHPWIIEQMDRIEVGEDAMDKAIHYIAEYYG